MSLIKTQNPDGKSAIYLSGAPEYKLIPNYIGGDPPFDCTYIFANRCIFVPQIVIGREFHLHTAALSVVRDGSFLSSSGVDGVQNISATDEHANGTNASQVWLSTSNFELWQSLQIRATGGNGGEGFTPANPDGKPGSGGNAGEGADVILFADTTFDMVADAGDAILSALDTPSKLSDMQTWAQLAQLVSEPSKVDGISWVFKTKLDQTQPDMDPEGPLPHAINAKTWLGLMADTVPIIRQLSLDYIWNIDCHSGKPGNGGLQPGTKTRGLKGQQGKDGRYQRNRISAADTRNSTECLFHPDQVAMTVVDIENSYYIGTDDSIQEARDKLQVLIRRLSFLDTLVPTDNLYQAYAKNEYSALAVLPSMSKVPTSVTSLKGSLSQAKRYMSQLNQGLDFYRRAKTWVPRGSYKLYEDAFTQVLQDFDAIEQDYEKYQELKADNSKRMDQLQKGMQAAIRDENLANSSLQTLGQELRETADRIGILQAEIPGKHKAVEAELDKLSDKIKTSFKMPSFKDFLGAASMMAFCPEPGMAAVQGLTLLNGSASEVKDDMGNSVDKDYVVEKIQSLKGDLDGLKEALTVTADDPNLNVDDPGATKLLGQEKDIMDLVDQYRGVLGGDLDDFKAMFDDYVNSVLQRNNQVMHYNNIITVFLQTRDKRDAAHATQGTLGMQEAMEINSEIPALAATIKSAYLNYTAQVLELLYDTQRALTFWSLDPNPAGNLSSLRQEGFPSQGLGENLKAIKGEIIKNFVDATNALSVGRQPFGIIQGNTGGEAKRIELTQYQLSALKMAPYKAGGDYAVSITIPIADKMTSLEQNVFASNADIRVSKVRCYLEGVKTTDGNLTISLQHLGDETIVSVYDEYMEFSHDHIPFVFEYNVINGAVLRDGDIGTDGDTYALPGPFAMWRIGVSTTGNKRPDLSRVTKAWLEFSGYSRSFR